MRDLVIQKVDPDEWDRLNENLKVIAEALTHCNERIAIVAEQVQELRSARPVGDDKSTTD